MQISLFDKQMAFFKETAKTACWIGGRGCGKTFTLALWVLDQCMKYPGVRGIVGSSSNPQLRQATIPDFIDVFDQIGVGYDFSEWNGTLQFGNGSRFKFQSFDVPEDRVKGGNIGFFAVDEIDACPEAHIRKINLAVRHQIGSRERRFIGNSPPPGHWLEKWFVPEVAKEHGKQVRGPLHQASLFDNYLLPPDFVEEVLKDNPPGSIEYRRHVMGELRVPQEGAVYKEFEASRHVVKYSEVPWDRLVGSVNSLDLGNNHWTVFLKGVLSDDDVLYVIDEFATRRDYLDYIADGVKTKWWSWVDEENDPGTIYSDHDAQDRMELARLGVETVPAIKGDIVRGISAVKERLRDNKLKIVGDNCPHLIGEFPNYIWAGDDSKPGKDEPVDKFNDALDALRYMVNGLDDEPDLIESAIMSSEENYGYSSP